jgi:hypothetical protein
MLRHRELPLGAELIRERCTLERKENPMRIPSLILGVLFAFGVALAADAPYLGKWKMNAAKSDFGESTVTYEQTPSKEFKVTADGETRTFKIDGKDYPSFDGRTAAWKQIDDRTWQSTHKLDGKTLWTRSIQVSPDGKTLRVELKGTNPDGTPMNDTTVYERVSGSTGLVGKWKTKTVAATAGIMELAPHDTDGITWTDASIGSKIIAKFDGKDYPAKGATFGPGYTMALKKTGPTSFETTVKYQGKPIYASRWMVSADGKSLTETGEAVQAGEKYKVVYDRQ